MSYIQRIWTCHAPIKRLVYSLCYNSILILNQEIKQETNFLLFAYLIIV